MLNDILLLSFTFTPLTTESIEPNSLKILENMGRLGSIQQGDALYRHLETDTDKMRRNISIYISNLG